MAAPTVTVTVRESQQMGQKNVVFGTLALSASYVTGGDTFDPGQFGLQILSFLVLDFGLNVAGTNILFGRAVGPYEIVANHDTPGGKIQAFTAAATEASGDLSGYTFDYMAIGV